MDLNTSSSSTVAFENNLSAVVSHEQMQVGTVADGLVVCGTGRRSFACDAADCLRGPDEASVVAVSTIARVGGVQVRDPGLSFEFCS